MKVDQFYPIGSIYETSDPDFNPNTSFGGNWVWRNERSEVIISESASYALGTQGGENSHSLTVDEIGSHTHSATYSNFHAASKSSTGWQNDSYISSYSDNIKNTSSSASSRVRLGIGTLTYNSTGSGAAHNNMQPYIKVMRWERIA